MRTMIVTILASGYFAITAGAHGACAVTGLSPQTPQAGGVSATVTRDGFTLSITARCEYPEQPCLFTAEIHAPRTLLQLIERVEYAIPQHDRRRVTDSSTNFRFEGSQMIRQTVAADVILKSRGIRPPKVVHLEATIPFAVEVTPPLPSGLRFEVNYRSWYLEGVPHQPVEYLFTIQLLGEPAVLKRIKSVEYRLPEDDAKRPRFSHRLETEYYLEGSMPNKDGVEILAAIRWQSGEKSTHTIPLRPR